MGGRIALLALGTLVAVPAQASSDKRDFEACDGRVHPGRQDDGMRGEAGTGRFTSLFQRKGDIGACTRALASPRLLPTQTLRRAHLLRARASAYLGIGDIAKAVADIDAAEAATANLANDRFYQRSMAVSLKLLRALALAQSDDMPGAVRLAREAGAARPYSLQIQRAAATIVQAARPMRDASPSPWLSAARLDPQAEATAISKEAEIGNFAGVLALRPNVTVNWPGEPLKPIGLVAPDSDTVRLLSAMLITLHTAYARAATGDAAGARRDLAEVRKHMAAARPAPVEGALAQLASQPTTMLDRYVETRSRQIEARIAVAEARSADAIGALVGAQLPYDAATIELLTALRAAVPVKDAGLVPDVAPFEKQLRENRLKELAGIAPSTLIAPETPRAVIDYERARPNILGALVGGALSMGTSLLGGIGRTDGFRTIANPDGTTKVEFIGNTPSAALVQEMTLLRAAEVTRAAGKPAFVIVERKDFSRRMTTTQYGVEISSRPTGFKTELTIRYVDAGADPQRALDAVAIIDALGPLYYEEKQTTS
ncbi:hypothetical protein LZK98_16685 [Sphingomonas cannabina]|uniref:hypothetical protein n=1 Tax=Sphingomonas cannabina TaxID=2899123 RepID=UPI001F2F8B61|nr:hypothetical protein [Sphingomonas cannabina]UIJ44672.1 hypothetical protein LZK98_16685 [Sphingomonas cannabina]